MKLLMFCVVNFQPIRDRNFSTNLKEFEAISQLLILGSDKNVKLDLVSVLWHIMGKFIADPDILRKHILGFR